MVLLRELFLRKLVQHSHLFSQQLCLLESFRHEHVLANKNQIRHDHSDRSEQSFKVVRQFRSACVSWIHSNEHSYSWNQTHVFAFELDLLFLIDKPVLHCLDLSGDDREYLRVDSVELVEAAPETCLDQP